MEKEYLSPRIDLSKKVSEKFNVDIDIASKGVLRLVNQLKELRLLDDNK